MSAKRLINGLLITLTILTVAVVGLEEVLNVLGRTSYLLWSANFVLLTSAIAGCIPLALYHLYSSWQVTKSYLV